MKILHTSDIHIDSPLTSRLSPDKVRQRRREMIRNFARLVSVAKDVGADAIIIAGDLFDSEKISKKAIDTALEVIESEKDIVFFYLQGNHEGDALLSLERAMPKNLMTFGKDWTYYQLGDVVVAGRSEIREGMFESLTLPEDSKNIIVLHGELREKCSHPESIGLKEAANKNVDYLALGHYHSYYTTSIDDRGVAVYSGTPEGRGFDEVGDKGFVIIDTNGARIKFDFRSFAERRLHIIQIDLTDMEKTAEISDAVASAVSNIPYSDMIRVELVGKYSPTLWKDSDLLSRNFGDRFYYFEVKDSSKIAINPEDYKFDKTLKGEFIRTVSADPSLDEETKERIIACGINALMGEDLFD